MDTKTTTHKRDLYQEVTDSIIQLLESAELKVEMPWTMSSGGLLPHNAENKKMYRGLNMLLLGITGMFRDYDNNGWLTFKQIKRLGGAVKKGEKSTTVIYWDQVYFDANGNKVSKDAVDAMSADQRAKLTRKSFLKHHLVFNVHQTTGLGASFYEVPEIAHLPEFERNAVADQLVNRTGAKIRIKGAQPCYIPSKDLIMMPDPKLFTGTEPYYSVLLHELTHWTGHASRLNRPMLAKFGSAEYAFEELVAELGSAYLCADIGFSLPVTQNAAYIQSWLKSLRNDKTWIFKASSQAEKAARFILTAKTGAYASEELTMTNH